MPELLLLGGPPAAGKSTVAPLLAERLAPCAWVEADDLWRISPWEVTEQTRAIVEDNITHVVRRFLAADYAHVVLVWVLHRQDLIERLVRRIAPDTAPVRVVHLVAEPADLRRRIVADPRPRSAERAVTRLRQISTLPYPRIDTTDTTPRVVVDRLCALIERTPRTRPPP